MTDITLIFIASANGLLIGISVTLLLRRFLP